MEEDIKENGRVIKCMEKVFSHGRMVENMMDNISTIKKKAMEDLSGQMVENTWVTG